MLQPRFQNTQYFDLSAQDPRVYKTVLASRSFPLHSILTKTDKRFFCEESLGLVAYEIHGDVVVVAGDPVTIEGEDSALLFSKFVEWAHASSKAVCGYYFSESLAQKVELRSFHAGVSRSVSLPDFGLHGYARRDVRRALNQGARGGLEWFEISHERKAFWQQQILSLEEEWLSAKKAPRIGFLLSSPKSDYIGAKHERWFVVRNPNTHSLDAFITLVPYGQPGVQNYYVDQMVYQPQGHRFALDFLLAQSILRLKEEKCSELSLGFCAFQGFEPRKLLEGGLWLGGKSKWPYNSKGIYDAKRKFTSVEKQRYILLDPEYSYLSQVFGMVRATFGTRRRVKAESLEAVNRERKILTG